MNEKRKWDWVLIGKAVSVVIEILSRIREAMGKATLDWEMMVWLATKAPRELYVKVWGEITSAWQVSKMEGGVLVKCDGDPDFHKCRERDCPHRFWHHEQDGCTKRVHNNARGWCRAPGTRSMINRGEEDGGLVTCVPAAPPPSEEFLRHT